MNDMERRKFEDSFKDAFDEAQVTPSENVWTNIELDLEKAEGGKMKRRLLFYKLLAAASVAFAMGVAGVGYYTMSTTNVNELQATSEQQEVQQGQLSQADPAEEMALSSEAAAAAEKTQQGQGSERSSQNGLSGNGDQEDENAIASETTQKNQPRSQTGLAASENLKGENAVASGTTSPAQKNQLDQQRSVQRSQTDLAATVNPKGENAVASGTTSPAQKNQLDQQRSVQRSQADLAATVNQKGENAVASGTTSPAQKNQLDQQRSVQRSQADLAATVNQKGENAVASGTTSPAQKNQLDQQRSVQRSQTDLAANGNPKGENAVISGTTSQDQKSRDEQRSQTGLEATGNPKGGSAIAAGTTSPVQKPQQDQQGSQIGLVTSDNSNGENAIASGTTPSAQKDQQEQQGAVQPSQTGLTTTGNPKGENAIASGATVAQQDQLLSISTSKGLPALVRLEKVVFKPAPAPEADPVALMMARLAEKEKAMGEEEKKKKESTGEKLWTSVGLAAGGFNTVNGSVSSNSMASLASSSIADDQAKPSGVVYTIGVSVGTRLSNRWVLQGGVNYLNQSSNNTAGGLVGAANFSSLSVASVNTLEQLNSDAGKQDMRYVPTSPFNYNNALEFISVPVQAGYLLVNKKFGVQLNAGVSTDLFVQNTITPEVDGLEKTTQGSGENSPYRTVNFSGLFGTEFSYRLGKHYRLAINPGVRYPFNSIYKSDIGLEAMPLTFDVGLKFRYIFR
jgi:hypothetical protein